MDTVEKKPTSIFDSNLKFKEDVTLDEKVTFFKELVKSLNTSNEFYFDDQNRKRYGSKGDGRDENSYFKGLQLMRGKMVVYAHCAETTFTLRNRADSEKVIIETNDVMTDPDKVWDQIVQFVSISFFQNQHTIFEKVMTQLYAALFPRQKRTLVMSVKPTDD